MATRNLIFAILPEGTRAEDIALPPGSLGAYGWIGVPTALEHPDLVDRLSRSMARRAFLALQAEQDA